METITSSWVVFIVGLPVLAAAAAVFCLFFMRWNNDDERRIALKKKKKEDICVIPQGSKGWPLIGETLNFIACGYTSNPVSFMDKRKSLYGDVFQTHILGKAIIVSTDPDVNKMILQNHGNMFVPCYPKSITELFGKASILQTNGSLHKRLHSTIAVFLKSPNFKARITKDIENSVKLSLSSWMDDKTPLVYLQDQVKKMTFEILVRVLLSVGPGDEMNLFKREFEEFIKGLICLPIKLPGTRLYKSLQAKKRLLKMVNKIIEDRKASTVKKDDNGSPADVMDALLRETIGESDETRLHHDQLPVDIEENMELKKRKDHSCEEYSWSDYMSLKFTQNVISETLRLANIINAVWRKALKDVKIKGYLIPKGWCVLASLSSVHMDKMNYENPLEFDPWRWKDIGAGAISNIFTPFGGGQRLCPGLELSRLEISIFLHHLSTTYRWVAGEEDEMIYFPTVRMKRKLPIIITPLLHQ